MKRAPHVALFHKRVIEELDAPAAIFGTPRSDHLKRFLTNTR